MGKSIDDMKNNVKYIVVTTSEFDAPIIKEMLHVSGIRHSNEFTLDELKAAVDVQFQIEN